MPKKAIVHRLGLAIFVFLACGEALVRTGDQDFRLLRRLLYYQFADVSVHAVSSNPKRHYALKPRSRELFDKNRVVTVNSAGYRGAERETRKNAGTYRILAVGGSTVYGAAVSDDETYPAQLERELNRSGRGRFEVWNAGTCAYVLSQDVAAAEESMRILRPDMVLFMPTNTGRRAFLAGTDPRPFFEADAELFPENLLIFPFRGRSLSLALVEHWRFYRFGLAAINLGLKILWDRNAATNSPRYDHALSDVIEDSLNRGALRTFYGRYHDEATILLVAHPSGAECPVTAPGQMPCVDLRANVPPQAPPEYRLVHPGPAVYGWYARTLARLLKPYLEKS
jgi:hypothetical protein